MKNYRIPLVCVALTLCWMIFQALHYPGIAWDEPAQRFQNGKTNWESITSGMPENMLMQPEKYHGPAWELFLFGVEKVFSLEEEHIYPLRHLLGLLLFFFGAFVFFQYLKLSGLRLATCIFGLVLMVLYPRLLGESLYNSKDLPAMVFLIFNAWFMLKIRNESNYKRVIGAGIVAGFALAIRIPLGFPLLIMGLFTFIPKRQYTLAGVWGMVTFISMVIFWPVLWNNPIHHLGMAFKEMSAFPWMGKVLFLGQLYFGHELPWYYLPTWWLCSFPLLVFLGLFFLMSRRCNKNALVMENALIIVGFTVYLILSKSTLYDGWRHVYFLYPSFLWLSLKGMDSFFQKDRIIQQMSQWQSVWFLAQTILWTPALYAWENPIGLICSTYAPREKEYWGVTASMIDSMPSEESVFASHAVFGYQPMGPSLKKASMGDARLWAILPRDYWFHSSIKTNLFEIPKAYFIKTDSLIEWKNNTPLHLHAHKEFSSGIDTIYDDHFSSPLRAFRVKGYISGSDSILLVASLEFGNKNLWWYGEPVNAGAFVKNLLIPHVKTGPVKLKMYLWNRDKREVKAMAVASPLLMDALTPKR